MVIKLNATALMGIFFFSLNLNGSHAAQASAATPKPPVGEKRRIKILEDYMDPAKTPHMNAQQMRWAKFLLRSEFARLKAEQAELHRVGAQVFFAQFKLSKLARLRLELMQAAQESARAAEKEKRDAQHTQQFLSSQLAQVQSERSALMRQVATLNAALTIEREKNAKAALDLMAARNKANSLQDALQAKDAQITNKDALLAHHSARIEGLKAINAKLANDCATWLQQQKQVKAKKALRRATMPPAPMQPVPGGTVLLTSIVPSSLTQWMSTHAIANPAAQPAGK